MMITIIMVITVMMRYKVIQTNDDGDDGDDEDINDDEDEDDYDCE
jgi:hypothetical protein